LLREKPSRLTMAQLQVSFLDSTSTKSFYVELLNSLRGPATSVQVFTVNFWLNLHFWYCPVLRTKLHFQLLFCTWTLDATNMFEVLTQTQFKVFFCSFSLPTGAPSTRPRSTQYVRRWWHHDSAVAAVNPCSVSVGYTVPVQ
jgi:hypothetical protein